MPQDHFLTSSSTLRVVLILGILSLFADTTYEAEQPGPRAAPIHFTAGAHEATVPVQVYAEHIFVPVRVNSGETTWFVLDTGANETVISKPLAEKAGLAFLWETGTEGVVGSTAISTAKDVLLKLPGCGSPNEKRGGSGSFIHATNPRPNGRRTARV